MINKAAISYRESPGLGYGWIASGNSGGTWSQICQKITFSTELWSSNSGLNADYGFTITTLSDASTYGYSGCAYDTVPRKTMYRLTFSTYSSAACTTANLATETWGASGLNDTPGGYGYMSGGKTGASINVATTYRMTFSTSTVATRTVSNISTAREGSNGLCGGNTYGWYVGGIITAGTSKTVDKMTFSTGACAAFTTSTPSLNIAFGGNISDPTFTIGYMMGSFNGTEATGNTEILIFSTEVFNAMTTANILSGGLMGGAVSSGVLYGYHIGGGQNYIVDKITFSTSVRSLSSNSHNSLCDMQGGSISTNRQ